MTAIGTKICASRFRSKTWHFNSAKQLSFFQITLRTTRALW